MVRAKAMAKPKGFSKLQQQSAQQKKSKAAKKSEVDVPCCCECGCDIDEDKRALQCERCSVVETWKCAQCLGMKDELYDYLASSASNGLHWFCDKCDEWVLDSFSVVGDKVLQSLERIELGICAGSDSMEKKFACAVEDLEAKLAEKVSVIEQMLNKKVEQDLLKAVDERLKKLEEKPSGYDELQQCLEKKMDKLCTSIDEPVSVAVQGAVKTQLEEDKAEEAEISKRVKNVIVHGVQESEAEQSEKRIDDDLLQVAAMLYEAGVDDVKAETVIRLGKKPADPTKSRPMKVVLDSEDNKWRLIRSAKNLRNKKEGGWSNVFVHQDLTPKQREVRKKLVEEMKDRVKQGEKDLTIYNGKIVKKRPQHM